MKRMCHSILWSKEFGCSIFMWNEQVHLDTVWVGPICRIWHLEEKKFSTSAQTLFGRRGARWPERFCNRKSVDWYFSDLVASLKGHRIFKKQIFIAGNSLILYQCLACTSSKNCNLIWYDQSFITRFS